MEVQLQELLDRIQKEGVGEAERKASAIIKQAEEKAAALLDDAKKEAAGIIAGAGKEAEQRQERGRQTLKQAGRDLVLKVHETIIRVFDVLLKEEIKTALKGDVLESIIATMVETWAAKGTTDLEILLSAEDRERIKKYLAAKLKKKLVGIELKPVAAIDAGFRIREKDGAAYYNITDEGIAEILAAFVNPELAAILKEAAAETST